MSVTKKMDKLHRAMDNFNRPVEEERACERASNSLTTVSPPLNDDDVNLLSIMASTSRQRILTLLGKGVDHPEELARRLKLRRQSVDKQLLELHSYGFVDRSAIFPADGRPRIVYRLSDRGSDLLGRVQTAVVEYRGAILADFRCSLQLLEDKLSRGELDEEAYLRQRGTLEARYFRFLAEGGVEAVRQGAPTGAGD